MFELMRGDHARAAPNAFELARLAREHELPLLRAFGVVSRGLGAVQSGATGGGLEDMRRGVELLREQNVLMFDGLLKIALAEAEARAGDADRAVAILDEALATCRPHRLSRIRSRTASGARRNPAEARSRQPRACGRSLPDRHRGREAARHAQLRTARRALARQALSIDRPPRRSPRRPRARARRLCADARNAGDRRGAGAARGAGGDRRGQGRRSAAPAAAASANGLRPGDDVGQGVRRRGNQGRLLARDGAYGQDRQLCGPLRGGPLSMDLAPSCEANCGLRGSWN